MMPDGSAPTHSSPSDDELVIEIVSPDVTPPDPQLSIAHLMIWTALSGAMMAFYNLIMSVQRTASGSEDNWMNSPIGFALRTVWAMAAGANLGGVLLLFARRWRGQAFPAQPGEWLIVMQGIGCIFGMLLNLGNSVIGYLELLKLTWVYLVLHLIGQLVNIVEYLLPAFLCKDNGAWRRFFWVATIVAFLSAGVALVSILAHDLFFRVNEAGLVRWIPLGICAVAFLLAVVNDLRRRIQRGWVHWVGVVALTLQFLNHEAWYIYWEFIKDALLKTK
jgi:hypothetical protein